MDEKDDNVNPFAGVPAKPAEGALTAVEQHRAVAEVQAAILIAKRFPRDPIAAMDKILQACTRPTLAEQSLYSYSRGGTEITGPSIRLAEALAQQWGNIKTSVRELDQTNGASTVQTIAWDLETGYQCDKVFQVPHVRHTKKGSYRLEDPRDIYELSANQGARRLRACILAVIPGDVVEAAVRQCETTLKTKAEVTPERIKSLLEKFSEFGVTQAQLEKRIQRHIDALTPALMVQLGKVFNSLKDGMSAPADWFDVEQSPEAESTQHSTRTDAVKEALRKRSAAPQESPSAGPPAGSPAGPVASTGMTVIDAIAKLQAYKDIENMAFFADGLSDEIRRNDRFGKAFRSRLEELKEREWLHKSAAR